MVIDLGYRDDENYDLDKLTASIETNMYNKLSKKSLQSPYIALPLSQCYSNNSTLCSVAKPPLFFKRALYNQEYSQRAPD